MAGQTIHLAGTVVDGVSGRPIPGARVVIGVRELVSDAEGRFEFDIAAGRGEIEVSAANYTSRKLTFDASSQPAASLVIQLIPENVFKESLEVTGTAPTAPRLDEPATIPLPPQQVLSTAGSLDNPFRTLQLLPGVAATDELGSKLSIRGGAPDQNLTIMDGIEMHNPYRLFGLTSAFNPETVSRFELLAGGFSARYGDRLSSVIVAENRDGDASRRFTGSSSLSITDANIIGEGRLPGPGQGTFLATIRRTYYDLVAERFIHQDLPSFNDTQIKTAWHLPGGRRLSLLGLRSRETTNITPDEDIEGTTQILSRNDLAAATLVSPLGRTSSTSIVAWSRNTDLIDAREDQRSASERNADPDQFRRQLSIDDLSLREELRLPLGRHQLEAGTEWHQLGTRVSFTTFDDRDPFGFFRGGALWLGGVFPSHADDSQTTLRGGAWLEDRFKVGTGLSVVPGLRWDWSGFTGDASVSPRLSAVMALNSATRLTAAGGLFTQSPGYEKVLQADHFTDLTGSAHLDLRPERATHVIVGLDRDLGGMQARVETYYKGFSDLIAGRLETEEERLARLARYDFPPSLASSVPSAALITSVPTNDSKGHAYGLDLFLTRPDTAARPQLTGWLSYSFARTEQEVYGRHVPFSYDRRHAMSLVWNWRPGTRFEIAGTTRIASGFPRTPPAGIRVASVERGSVLVPSMIGPNRFDLEVAPGGVAELNSERFPTSARVDLRLGYRPRGVTGRWQLYLEILNALNRENAWFMDANIVGAADGGLRLQEEPIGGLPRIATIGVRFHFP